jgi:hypothetical protein
LKKIKQTFFSRRIKIQGCTSQQFIKLDSTQDLLSEFFLQSTCKSAAAIEIANHIKAPLSTFETQAKKNLIRFLATNTLINLKQKK